MGFDDVEKARELLEQHQGDFENALQAMLRTPSEDAAADAATAAAVAAADAADAEAALALQREQMRAAAERRFIGINNDGDHEPKVVELASDDDDDEEAQDERGGGGGGGLTAQAHVPTPPQIAGDSAAPGAE